MSWYTYILQCSDGSYYVGHTSNLQTRLQDHQRGRGAEYTKRRRPIELVYYERRMTEKDVIAREGEIKGWSRIKKKQLIDSVGWTKSFAIAVYAIIQNKKNDILLMRYADRNVWMLPGGGVEEGEDIILALRREIREETGQIISSPRIVGVHDKLAQKKQLIIVFACEIDETKTFESNSEAIEISFFSLKQLPEEMHPYSLDRIHAYCNQDIPYVLKVE